jgi:hypothetical protein
MLTKSESRPEKSEKESSTKESSRELNSFRSCHQEVCQQREQSASLTGSASDRGAATRQLERDGVLPTLELKQSGRDAVAGKTQPLPKSDITDSRGNRTIISADGKTVTYKGHDGTDYVHTLDDKGGFTGFHSGPGRDDNFKIEHKPDGRGGYVEKCQFGDASKNYTKEVARDGREVVTDARGNRTTISADGRTTTFEDTTGKSFTRQLDDKGGFTETHRGPKLEDNYKVERSPVGFGGYKEQYQFADSKRNYTKEVGPDGKAVITDAVGLKIEIKGGSPGFQENALAEFQKLPEAQRKLLAEKGIKCTIVGKISDIDPALATQRPRNWEEGKTWDDADGVFMDGKNIVVAEMTRAGKTNRLEGVLRHETGHGIDAALGHFSQSPEFQKAYESDMSKLGLLDYKDFHYQMEHSYDPQDGRKVCLSDKASGREEALADIYGALHGSSANRDKTQMFLERFPATAELLRKQLAQLN